MDLTFETETLSNENRTWLGSAHATENADSTKITVAGGDVSTYGSVLPSGTLISSTGTLDPTGTGAGTGDKKEASGFLLTGIDISRGAGDYSGAVIWHGEIDTAKRVSIGFDALTADQKADLTLFRFV